MKTFLVFSDYAAYPEQAFLDTPSGCVVVCVTHEAPTPRVALEQSVGFGFHLPLVHADETLAGGVGPFNANNAAMNFVVEGEFIWTLGRVSGLKMAPIDRYISVYLPALRKAIIDHGDEYAFPVTDAPKVAARMRNALLGKSYNKDGRAHKAACKALGISYTYKGINGFLAGTPTV